jgi:hypothetical protein
MPSGFRRKGIASLLGVSQVTLFRSGSVPNTAETQINSLRYPITLLINQQGCLIKIESLYNVPYGIRLGANFEPDSFIFFKLEQKTRVLV